MAAGAAERFGPGGRKQLVSLCGRPMLAWSMLCLSADARVKHFIVVGPSGAEREFLDAVPGALAAATVYVVGGETRQRSVANGLLALPAGTTHVLIHDAARPCVSAELRDRVVAALAEHDAVVPVVPVTDTIIRERDGFVESTVDRSNLSAVQTPQGFRAELVAQAHDAARARGFEWSDDGSLVLALGRPVATVAGERNNIKVTFRSDVGVAEGILRNGIT